MRFVLVEPSHVGNIGASARAIRTMGFTRLVVVHPGDPGFRDSVQARALAAAAGDVLTQARNCASLAQALEGVHLAFATTGYARQWATEPVDLRLAAQSAAKSVGVSDLPAAGQAAFVFGTERTGMLNEDVALCHGCCFIPADPLQGSLNLAQAVQVVAYEMRRALLELAHSEPRAPPRRDVNQGGARDADLPASVDETEELFRHLQEGIEAIGYLDRAQPRKLLVRLRRLILRARPTATEVDILRGIASAMILPRKLRAGGKKDK